MNRAQANLRPCPFCKNTDVAVKKTPTLKPQSIIFYVRCASCDADGPSQEFEADAIRAWNIRHDEGECLEDDCYERVPRGALTVKMVETQGLYEDIDRLLQIIRSGQSAAITTTNDIARQKFADAIATLPWWLQERLQNPNAPRLPQPADATAERKGGE